MAHRAQPHLQRASVAHHRLDRERRLGASEALDAAFAALNDRHRGLSPRKLGVDFQHLGGFLGGLSCSRVRRVALLPQELQRPAPQSPVARKYTLALLSVHRYFACTGPRGHPLPCSCPVLHVFALLDGLHCSSMQSMMRGFWVPLRAPTHACGAKAVHALVFKAGELVRAWRERGACLMKGLVRISQRWTFAHWLYSMGRSRYD